ncbi:MAG TPA: hypothetical protein VG796_16875 [Verrucomicrobiales bacterium]|nr:hypothetical protein [Verrucomicrobiales bacterium]
MKRTILLLLTLALLATFGTTYWLRSGRFVREGRRDAARDLENGKLGFEICGMMRGWDGEYAALLQQRYGIQLRSVAGCIVTEESSGHLGGYNAVMLPEIHRRFGAGVLERTADEARAKYNKRVAEIQAKNKPSPAAADTRQP